MTWEYVGELVILHLKYRRTKGIHSDKGNVEMGIGRSLKCQIPLKVSQV